LSKIFGGRHLWGWGYFVATSGNVTDEVIMEYIKSQDDGAETNDEFSIIGD
jgi:putative transposase